MNKNILVWFLLLFFLIFLFSSLVSASSFTFVEKCGNDAINSGEECDGTNLNNKQCTDLAVPGHSFNYHSGTLGCYMFPAAVECILDTHLCNYCGDGNVNGSEECDGTIVGQEGCYCNSNCTKYCHSDCDWLGVGTTCETCVGQMSVCSIAEKEKYLKKCLDKTKIGYWLRGVGWVSTMTPTTWEDLHQTPNSLSTLDCDDYTLVGDKEYLNYGGFVKVVQSIEEEHRNETGSYPNAFDLASAIAMTYYRADVYPGLNDARYNPLIRLFYPQFFSSDYSEYIENISTKYVLRHPEFYSGDSGVNGRQMLYSTGVVQTPSRGIGAYGGVGEECLIKKVYINSSEILSMSHLMFIAIGQEPSLFASIMEGVLGSQGKINSQNILGDLQGIGFSTRLWAGGAAGLRLSTLLGTQFISINTPPQNDLSDYCSVLQANGLECP